MNMIKQTPGLVYESPDGGKTVYSRKVGETERKLEYMSSETLRMIETNKQLELWRQIIEMSLTDENLADELNRVKLLYYLKSNGSKT